MACFLSAGTAGKVTATSSPFDGEGIRVHVVYASAFVILSALIVPFIDSYFIQNVNYQNIGLEVAIFVFIAYAVGAIGSYNTDYTHETVQEKVG